MGLRLWFLFGLRAYLLLGLYPPYFTYTALTLGSWFTAFFRTFRLEHGINISYNMSGSVMMRLLLFGLLGCGFAQIGGL